MVWVWVWYAANILFIILFSHSLRKFAPVGSADSISHVHISPCDAYAYIKHQNSHQSSSKSELIGKTKMGAISKPVESSNCNDQGDNNGYKNFLDQPPPPPPPPLPPTFGGGGNVSADYDYAPAA